MTTTPDVEVDRIRLRREATEALIRAGHYDGLGPAAMAAEFDPRFVVGPHTEVMNRELARLLITPGGSTMINTPPRIGKSVLSSQWMPWWWLTQRPEDRIVLAAYAERLAMRHAMSARDLAAAYGPQYGLELSRTHAAKSDWSLTTGGGMIARGVGSGLTGEDMGGLGIIDDPVKDRAAAESLTIRDGIWDWYSGAFLSRQEPSTRRLVVMTRWHQSDLAGRILDSEGRVEEGGVWRVVHLPAFALPPNPEKGIYADPLGRAPGEPLSHPKIAVLDVKAAEAHWERARAQSTARDWNALYQGTPYDAEGALLTDEQIRTATQVQPEQFKRIVIGVDPAGGGRDTVGIVAVGLDRERHAWFLDDRTARMSAAEWPDAVCLAAHEHHAGTVVVEKNFGGDMGKQLIAQAWELLVARGQVSGLCPHVQEVTARHSKVLRAEPVAQAILTGRVWFARGAGLKQLATEFTMWEPGSTWSPGALDAGVHAVTEVLPMSPRGSEVTNPVRRRRGDSGGGHGLTGRRR